MNNYRVFSNKDEFLLHIYDYNLRDNLQILIQNILIYSRQPKIYYIYNLAYIIL